MTRRLTHLTSVIDDAGVVRLFQLLTEGESGREPGEIKFAQRGVSVTRKQGSEGTVTSEGDYLFCRLEHIQRAAAFAVASFSDMPSRKSSYFLTIRLSDEDAGGETERRWRLSYCGQSHMGKVLYLTPGSLAAVLPSPAVESARALAAFFHAANVDAMDEDGMIAWPQAFADALRAALHLLRDKEHHESVDRVMAFMGRFGLTHHTEFCNIV